MTYTLSYDEHGFTALEYSGFISRPEAQDSSVKAVELAIKSDVMFYLADHSASVVVIPMEQGYSLMDTLADRTEISRNAKLTWCCLPSVGSPGKIWKASAQLLRIRGGWRRRSILSKKQPTGC